MSAYSVTEISEPPAPLALTAASHSGSSNMRKFLPPNSLPRQHGLQTENPKLVKFTFVQFRALINFELFFVLVLYGYGNDVHILSVFRFPLELHFAGGGGENRMV